MARQSTLPSGIRLLAWLPGSRSHLPVTSLLRPRRLSDTGGSRQEKSPGRQARESFLPLGLAKLLESLVLSPGCSPCDDAETTI